VVGYDIGEAIDKRSRTEFTFRRTGQTDFALMGAARALYNDKHDYSAWRKDAKKINAKEAKPAGSRLPNLHIGSKEVIASGNFVMKSDQDSRVPFKGIELRVGDDDFAGVRALFIEPRTIRAEAQ